MPRNPLNRANPLIVGRPGPHNRAAFRLGIAAEGLGRSLSRAPLVPLLPVPATRLLFKLSGPGHASRTESHGYLRYRFIRMSLARLESVLPRVREAPSARRRLDQLHPYNSTLLLLPLRRRRPLPQSPDDNPDPSESVPPIPSSSPGGPARPDPSPPESPALPPDSSAPLSPLPPLPPSAGADRGLGCRRRGRLG